MKFVYKCLNCGRTNEKPTDHKDVRVSMTCDCSFPSATLHKKIGVNTDDISKANISYYLEKGEKNNCWKVIRLEKIGPIKRIRNTMKYFRNIGTAQSYLKSIERAITEN